MQGAIFIVTDDGFEKSRSAQQTLFFYHIIELIISVFVLVIAAERADMRFGHAFLLIKDHLLARVHLSLLVIGDVPGLVIEKNRSQLYPGSGLVGDLFLYFFRVIDRKSTRLNSSHIPLSR